MNETVLKGYNAVRLSFPCMQGGYMFMSWDYIVCGFASCQDKVGGGFYVIYINTPYRFIETTRGKWLRQIRRGKIPSPSASNLQMIGYANMSWLSARLPTYYPQRCFSVSISKIVNIFGTSLFPNLWWIWFMFGMMIDTGPKFYSVPSPPLAWP